MTRLPTTRALILPVFLLGATILPACTGMPAPEASMEASLEAASLIVTGSATYRERIAAPKGSVLKVELSDTSRADAPAISLADWSDSLDDGGVPKRFTLQVNDMLDPRGTYTVRATVRGPEGELFWTTDTVTRVASIGTVDAGELVMVRVQSEPPKAGRPDLPELAGTEWIVEAMGGTGVVSGSEPRILFGEDGDMTGTTGCNRFFGRYSQSGAALGFSGIGMTRMACMSDGVMEQEAKFSAILGSEAAMLEKGGPGEIIIRGADGIGFTARRLPAEGDETGADPAKLTGAEWRVEDLNRGGIIDRSNLTITFTEDGRVHGSTQCNQFSGSYTATATHVTFTPLMMTLRACVDEALATQERVYIDALEGEMAWTMREDGAVELTRDLGHRVLLRR